MPKSFSDNERAYIKERLTEEAKACLTLYGIKKTTVDELVKRANIPKGTFYLFYESKEHLLFDVILQFNDEIQQKLIGEVSALTDGIDSERMTELVFGLYKALDGSFLPKLIVNGDLESFMRRLPPELSQMHADKDDLRFEELVSLVPNIKVDNIKAFSAAFRGIFLSLLHKKDLGEELFDEALRIMIRGVVVQMFEGEKQ